MDTLYLFILAVVQGITEFLPISSSAHLILLPHIMGEADQGLLIDIAVHVGTLVAVIAYFWRDIWSIIRAFIFDLKKTDNTSKHNRRLGYLVIIASLPVIIAGLGLHTALPEGIRDPRVIIVTTLFFGALLWFADRQKLNRSLKSITLKDALLIGAAQIFALIPGTSRSGVTMTAALFLGFKREDTAKFALLLGIPAIAGAGLLGGLDLIEGGDQLLQKEALIAATLSGLAAYAAIWLMMRWVKSATFTPFVIYRMLLGIYLTFTFIL